MKNLDVTNALVMTEEFFKNPAVTIWSLEDSKTHEQVAYFFKSGLCVRCEGSYFMAYIQQNVGNCTKGVRILKQDSLILYNYPNYGVLAISPKIAPWLQQVFEDQ